MVPPHLERRLSSLREAARLLDGAFRVPGTRRRFGWDPILGLVPWIGDAVTLVFGGILLVTAVQLRVPRVVQARILIVALLDFVIGLVPIAGDAVDFAFRANARNMALLERHAYESHPPSWRDWLLVGGFMAALLLALAIPVFLLAMLLSSLEIGLL